MNRAVTILAVLVGGAIGTGLRVGVETLIPRDAAELGIGTLLVNVAGAFLLGLLVARVWPATPDWMRAGLGPGLLGSFTTFSALALAVVEDAVAGAVWIAVAEVAVSVVAGLAAAFAGLRLGRPGTRPGPIGADE